METQETNHLQKNAEYLIMRCYETANGVNCYGYTPIKSKSPDYLRAKRKALNLSRKFPTLNKYIKDNL
jgi:hypothetical protein